MAVKRGNDTRPIADLDFTRRSIRIHILICAMVFGPNRYPAREATLGPLLVRNGESPGFSPFAFRLIFG